MSAGGGGGESSGTGATTVTKNVVLSDGTYATQTTIIGTCFWSARGGGVEMRWQN